MGRNVSNCTVAEMCDAKVARIGASSIRVCVSHMARKGSQIRRSGTHSDSLASSLTSNVFKLRRSENFRRNRESKNLD